LNIHEIKIWTYAFFLTNIYAIKLRKILKDEEKKPIRLKYSKKILKKLHITVQLENPEKIPETGQYLFVINHRSIIDPLIIDIALKDSHIFGLWLAKKELYDSLLFGNAVRNGGCIRVSRGNTDMRQFFSDIKEGLARGSSICIFPEGTRNKTEKTLLDFKEGVRIISRKNRLPIVPVYIRTQSNKTLDLSLKTDKTSEISIMFGDIIPYKESQDIKTRYQDMFQIED
jgi:1-acyl-sn-glycerol-3-phosphate acyltransferase